jgi:AraC-like DNA-binding protein
MHVLQPDDRHGEQTATELSNNYTPPLGDLRIRLVLTALHKQDLRNMIRLGDLALDLNVSTSRLHHLFTAVVGISPGRYVKLLRLQKARLLLKASSFRIKEVAALVGIEDLSHFVRDYKRLFGETPSQTRSASLNSRASESK